MKWEFWDKDWKPVMQFSLERVEIFDPSQRTGAEDLFFHQCWWGFLCLFFLNPSHCRQKQNQVDAARQATFVPTAGSGWSHPLLNRCLPSKAYWYQAHPLDSSCQIKREAFASQHPATKAGTRTIELAKILNLWLIDWNPCAGESCLLVVNRATNIQTDLRQK